MEAGLHKLKVPNNADEKEGVIANMFYVLSFACAKERTKPARTYRSVRAGKSTPAMIYGHCRPDSYRD
jgi:hypothetical protein